MSGDIPGVDPNAVVAGLFPNNPPPKALPVLALLVGWPNNPVPDVAGAVALLVVDPNVPPPLPKVEVFPPPPNAPKPVAGFAPPNSGFVALLLLFVLPK